MKFILIALISTIVFSAHAQTKFRANFFDNKKIVAITLVDDLIPPFEAGLLWSSMKGQEANKLLLENEFAMDCFAQKNNYGEMVGNCKMFITYAAFKKIGSKLVFKREGVEAAKLNRYFNDSAYVSMQRGDAYLSSYNTRRQFFFGLEESLIQH